MKMAQKESGEIDCIYTVGGRTSHSNNYWDDSSSLNYTQLVSVLEENGVQHNLSPRY